MIIRDPIAGRLVVATASAKPLSRAAVTARPCTLPFQTGTVPAFSVTFAWDLKDGTHVIYSYFIGSDVANASYTDFTLRKDFSGPTWNPYGGIFFNRAIRPLPFTRT